MGQWPLPAGWDWKRLVEVTKLTRVAQASNAMMMLLHHLCQWLL